MKLVKIIFISLEASMIIGIITALFITDWEDAIQHNMDWAYKFMIILMAIAAVVYQKEQQAIEWDEE